MLGINSFPPIIPSTVVAVLLGIEACMYDGKYFLSEILGNCAGVEALGLYEGLKLKVGL